MIRLSLCRKKEWSVILHFYFFSVLDHNWVKSFIRQNYHLNGPTIFSQGISLSFKLQALDKYRLKRCTIILLRYYFNLVYVQYCSTHRNKLFLAKLSIEKYFECFFSPFFSKDTHIFLVLAGHNGMKLFLKEHSYIP